MTSTLLPGLTVEVVPPAAEPEPLRTDVAGFIGRTRRGPLTDSGGAVAVRLDGQNDWLRYFGGLDSRASTPYAVRGYFENGGQIAWAVRVSGPAATAAAARWQPGHDTVPLPDYQVEAASPGDWANGTQVQISYLASGPAGRPTVDVRVEAPAEPVEMFTGLAPQDLPAQLASSQLVRLREQPDSPAPSPGHRRWASWRLTLTGGSTGDPPTADDYLRAVQALGDQPEVALVSLPDLYADLAGADRSQVLTALLSSCAGQIDRLALLDLPPDLPLPQAVTALRAAADAAGPTGGKSGAAYHPPLRVRDPLGGSAVPVRTVPPSGHVAGAISRLDRQRGPSYTPANTVLEDAVNLDQQLSADDEAQVFQASVNLLRCSPGQGLQIWGGQTLDSGLGRFVAHRRLLHLLVRAIRRVAAPLVFEINGPELRLTLVRAITAVLLQSFQAGALQGSRPDQAFRVQCDETNNPPNQDPALLVCEIAFAPAVPMEFIRLRLVIGQDARLEVVEA